LQAAKARLQPYQDRVLFINKNFRSIEQELSHHDIRQVDGILFDLGVSSLQLYRGERGFSYQHDAHLDMRMNQTQALSVFEIVNTWPYDQLVLIFFKCGEEKFSKQIASKIEAHRENAQIETTPQLVDIIKEGIPAAARRKGGHPAKRILRAHRTAVNDELSSVERRVRYE